MSETLKYLKELSRIVKVDEENKESIIENSIDGISGEEEAIMCSEKGSFLVEEFIAMYSLQQMNKLMNNIGTDKYFIIINDKYGSRVMEKIYERYSVFMKEMNERDKMETMKLLNIPILQSFENEKVDNNVNKEEDEEKNQMEEEETPKTMKEIISKKCGAHVISKYVELMKNYINENNEMDIIKKISERVMGEEQHEMEIETIPLMVTMIKVKECSIGKRITRILLEKDIPICDENWSVIVEAALEVMNENERQEFAKKYMVEDNIKDKIGNHIVKKYLEVGEWNEEVYEKVLENIETLIEEKYFMLIVELLKSNEKQKDKKKKKDNVKRICNNICGRGNVFDEGRKGWMKGTKGFIDYGYSMIMQELIRSDNQYMIEQFLQLNVKCIEDYINSKLGSHVIEMIIEKSNDKQLGKLIERLRGKIWRLSMGKASSYVIEKLYNKGSVKEKEIIAEEMNSNYDQLEKDFIGRKVAEKMKITNYRQNPTNWRKMMNNKKKLIESFNEIRTKN